MTRLKKIVLGLCLLTASGPAFGHRHSYRDIRRLFIKGLAKEHAGHYRKAENDFRMVLAEDPGLARAHRELGNCLYYQGENRAAVEEYDAYLAVYPGDTALRRFALRLGAVPDNRPFAVAAYPRGRSRIARADPAREDGRRHGSVFLGTELSEVFPDGGDLADYPASGGSPPSSDSAFQWDALQLGYLWSSGFGIAGGIAVFGRNAVVGSGYTSIVSTGGGLVVTSRSGGDAIGVNEQDYYAEPLYRFTFSRRLGLLVGMKVGLAQAQLADSGNNITNASASGFFVSPEALFQILFGGRFGLDLGLDYRYAALGAVDVPGQGAIPSGSGPGNWRLNDSGLGAEIGFTLYFRRLGG